MWLDFTVSIPHFLSMNTLASILLFAAIYASFLLVALTVEGIYNKARFDYTANLFVASALWGTFYFVTH